MTTSSPTDTIFIYDGNSYAYEQAKQIAVSRKNSILKGTNDRMVTIANMVEGKTVLDFGCSIGDLSYVLGERGFNVIGVDRLQSAIDMANTFCKNENTIFITDDILDDPAYSNRFDTIIFAETIEHVENPFLILKSFHKMLKENGCIIISTPNGSSIKQVFYALSYRKKLKRSRLVREIQSEPKQIGTQLEHIYAWDFVTLTRLLDRTGFSVEDNYFFGGIHMKFPIIGSVFIKNKTILKSLETLMAGQIIKARKKL